MENILAYSGSGIFRNVWLILVNKSHVDQWRTFISTSNVSEKASTVNISTEIKNQYSSGKTIILKIIICDVGMVNVLRYHPIPLGNAPPPGVAALSLLKAPSILQSCGKLSVRQLLSLH